MLSLDGTKLTGNAARKANRTLPQIEKLLAEAAEADAADDARHGGTPPSARPRWERGGGKGASESAGSPAPWRNRAASPAGNDAQAQPASCIRRALRASVMA